MRLQWRTSWRHRKELKHAGRQGGRRLTPTLTTLSILLPAASRMAFRLRQHWAVFSAMEPSIRLPWVSAGIWAAHQTWPAALMAWLYGPAAVGGEEGGGSNW